MYIAATTTTFFCKRRRMPVSQVGVVGAQRSRTAGASLRAPLTARNFRSAAVKNPALQKVLDLCAPCERGASTSDDARAAILDAVAALKASSPAQVTTGKELSATWKLVWTTEKVRVGRHVHKPASSPVFSVPIAATDSIYSPRSVCTHVPKDNVTTMCAACRRLCSSWKRLGCSEPRQGRFTRCVHLAFEFAAQQCTTEPKPLRT